MSVGRQVWKSDSAGCLTPLLTGARLQSVQERIKSLEFQDCKVRVTNVDSQAAGENIVIQVIGELSNKSLEPKKFVQTFILAQQPSGYFVLNDIMRYIDEQLEGEQDVAPEAEQAPATTEPEAAAAAEGHVEPESSPAKEEEPSKEAEPAPLDAAVVDQKLEDAKTEDAPAAAETSAEPAVEVEPAVVKPKEDAQPEPVSAEKAIKEIEKEDAKAEVPKDPSPTPAIPRAAPAEKPAPAEPEKPKEPPAYDLGEPHCGGCRSCCEGRRPIGSQGCHTPYSGSGTPSRALCGSKGTGFCHSGCRVCSARRSRSQGPEGPG